MKRKISSNLVLTAQGFEENVVLTLDENGVITHIERGVEHIDSIANLEFYNGILIPGMVNAHSHIEYSYVKGMITRGAGLPEFIRSIIEIKIKNAVLDSDKASAAKAWDAVLYNQGVVAVADHNNNDYVYEMKKESKIYYHDLIEIYDVDGQDADTTFRKDAYQRMEYSHSQGLAATVVPHACYTMEDRLMELTGGEKVSKDGLKATGVVSTHFKENANMGGVDETQRVVGSISAERDSVILVHCIYATEEDISAAKSKFGNKLFIVPCPLSNIFIEKRMGDFDMFRRLGVNIALGTDSLSSNDMLSMVDEMKSLAKHYPSIPVKEIIEMATINGARALGIESWAGSFEVGKHPSVVLLEGMDLQNIGFTDSASSRRII